jgi:death-on-curing protein
METFLMLNGYELRAPTDEQERIMLDLAAGTLTRDTFSEWVKQHTFPRAS